MVRLGCRGICPSPAVTCSSLRPNSASEPASKQPQLQLCASLRRLHSGSRHKPASLTLPAAAASGQKPAPDAAAAANVHLFPFTLQHLVTFQAVACADCVDAAAEHLGLAKRSVHTQLAKLEETVSILYLMLSVSKPNVSSTDLPCHKLESIISGK